MDASTSEEMVLGMLADAGDACVPGDILAGKLGLAPSQVFRHVEDLRRKGYRIDTLGTRGYRLVAIPDRLTPLEIGPFLTTHDLGRGIHHRESVTSTNEIAYRLAEEGAFHGEVVIAEHQSRGKGRRGRTWESPARRNLYLSVILRPDLPATRAPELTLVAAVALAQTLREAFDLEVGIKWPNDVELEDRKLAGILTELATDGDRIDFVILGIGLNVNMRRSELPAEVAARATSVGEAFGENVDRPILTAAILARLEHWYDRWLEEGLAPVREAWKAYATTLGRNVRVQQGSSVVEGVAEDLDTDGALLVRVAGGKRVRVVAGDVEHLRLA